MTIIYWLFTQVGTILSGLYTVSKKKTKPTTFYHSVFKAQLNAVTYGITILKTTAIIAVIMFFTSAS